MWVWVWGVCVFVMLQGVPLALDLANRRQIVTLYCERQYSRIVLDR